MEHKRQAGHKDQGDVLLDHYLSQQSLVQESLSCLSVMAGSCGSDVAYA